MPDPHEKLTLERIPLIDPRVEEHLALRATVSRRTFVQRVAAAGAGVGVAYLGLASRATPAGAANDGNYWLEWTGATTGPCGPGGYASNHTEEGRKCGPSAVCGDLSCCSTEAQPPPTSGSKAANQRNAYGWHKVAGNPGDRVYYRQRPDDCWSNASGSDYDAWRWRFSDGKTYGCSDGRTVTNGQSVNTICPWDVRERMG